MSLPVINQLAYQWRFYNGMRSASRAWSPEHDMADFPFPKGIQLQTINACQAACIMCPYPLFKNVFPRGRMDDALFEKVIAEIAEHREVDTFIPMLQNEPFLDKQLFAKIQRFKALTAGRIKVELVTNGAFLTDENIAQVRDSGIDILDVSLDAVSRDTYRRVRIGLDFDAVIAGVERVIAARLPHTQLFVRLVRVRQNIREVRAFTKRWRSLGIPVFIYTANNRVGAVRDFEQEVKVADADVPLAMRVLRRGFRQWIHHCPIPFSSTNILHNGDMLMCVHDWARNEIIGNVRDATIAELWNGPRMRELRAMMAARRYQDSPACRNCSLWKDGWF